VLRKQVHHATDRTLTLAGSLATALGSLSNRDAVLEGIELFHAGVAAHADDLVPAIQGVLHHVLPELS
jgi:hypothetical protein